MDRIDCDRLSHVLAATAMNPHPPNQPSGQNSSNSGFDPNTFAPLPTSKKTFLAELAGVVIMIGGFLGYWLYLELQEAPILTSSSPSPTTPKLTSPTATPAPPTLTVPGAIPTAPPVTTPVDRTQTPALNPADEIYQRSPRTGIYYAANPLLSASRREIVGGGDRYCIKLVNGPIQQAGIDQQEIVSSLSVRSDGIYIDATQEKLNFDRTYTEFSDSLGTWQLLERKEERAGTIAACLATKEPFVRQIGDTSPTPQP
jgi:hypothetical protein